MKELNLDFFRVAGACYDPETVLGTNWTGTILDILQMPNIPANDRLWAATRAGVLDDKTLRLFACTCVRETPLADGRKVWDLLTNERSRNAIVVAERYATGEATNEELAAARAAAWDAASTAAWAAVSTAAWDAARASASTAAWVAARASASTAAWVAARASASTAAWAAAWDAQVDILIEMLKG